LANPRETGGCARSGVRPRLPICALALLFGCGERLPEFTIECRDGTYFTSHKGMPDSRLCDGKGGVVNSITIVEGKPKPRGR
jgi:hypothetical protein